MKYQDVMIDLETLGQSAGCIILSIGAVAFGPDGLGEEFYAVVNTNDCKKAGLFTDPSTVEWWEKQDVQARQVLKQAASKSESMPLKLAIDGLNDFLRKFGPNVRVWGNGADFDNPIVVSAAKAALREVAWKFWNSRCFRTVKSMAPKSAEPKREGTYHNALDDAKHQARWAIELTKKPHNIKVFGA